jgi:hypothetical protein
MRLGLKKLVSYPLFHRETPTSRIQLTINENKIQVSVINSVLITRRADFATFTSSRRHNLRGMKACDNCQVWVVW